MVCGNKECVKIYLSFDLPEGKIVLRYGLSFETGIAKLHRFCGAGFLPFIE